MTISAYDSHILLKQGDEAIVYWLATGNVDYWEDFHRTWDDHEEIPRARAAVIVREWKEAEKLTAA